MCLRKTIGYTKFNDREPKSKDMPKRYHLYRDYRPTKSKQVQTNIHTVEGANTDSLQSDDVSFTAQFKLINISDLNFQPVNRRETYSFIVVICPDGRDKHKSKLRVGKADKGNTLPLRTFKQVYLNDELKDIV